MKISFSAKFQKKGNRKKSSLSQLNSSVIFTIKVNTLLKKIALISLHFRVQMKTITTLSWIEMCHNLSLGSNWTLKKIMPQVLLSKSILLIGISLCFRF